MRKTTIQAIINILLIVIFAIFVVVYGRIASTTVPIENVWFGVFLLLVGVLCLSKYVLYQRQNFIFFSFVFVIDSVILLLNAKEFTNIITKRIGIFVLVPAGVLALFYIRYREVYQRNFAIVLGLVGALLLILID